MGVAAIRYGIVGHVALQRRESLFQWQFRRRFLPSLMCVFAGAFGALGLSSLVSNMAFELRALSAEGTRPRGLSSKESDKLLELVDPNHAASHRLSAASLAVYINRRIYSRRLKWASDRSE